jgi:hypothetical protein
MNRQHTFLDILIFQFINFLLGAKQSQLKSC